MSNAHKRKPSYHHITLLDPIKYVKQLESVGFTREQAEMQSETFFSIVQDKLVTKEDLKTEIAAVRRDIKESENKTAIELEFIRRDIKESDNKTAAKFETMRRDMELFSRDLKIWLGGMSITVVAIFSAIVTLIPHFTAN